MGRHLRQVTCVLAIGLIAAAVVAKGRAQSIRHDTGQDVAPAFEGWELNADGSFNFVFGYLNRNYEEQVDIPIGRDNFFDQGQPDRGQPTHFYARRQRFIFRVAVPKDWDKGRKLVWTLTSHGRTNQAKGWLQPEWELSPGVISENNNGGVLEAGNKPPTLTGNAAETVKLPNPLTLTVTASDDGLPKPKPRRTPQPDSAASAAAVAAASAAANPDRPVRLSEGLRVKWVYYRGPGKVTFDPDASKPEYKPSITASTKATFSAPGTYVVRVFGSDGQLESFHDITVTVNPE